MNESSFPSSLPIAGLRWVARLLALALAGLIVAMAIGEGFNPTKLKARELALTIPFFVMWLGLLVGWRWEGLGGLLVVAGVAGFYLLHFAVTGFGNLPRGWVFPSLALPGILFLACWFWEKPHAAAAQSPP